MTHVLFGGERTLTLKCGILVYQGAADEIILTQHDVRNSTENPQAAELTGGTLIGMDVLARLVQAATNAPAGRFLLPENVLAYDPSYCIWWQKSRRRAIFFRTADKEFNEEMEEATILYPPLVFIANSGNLFVYALAADVRPDKNTKLLQAPFYNIADNGHMCSGNVVMPDVIHPLHLREWEDCFFETYFVHSNTQELCTHPSGIKDFWRVAKQADSLEKITPYLLERKDWTLNRLIEGRKQ